MSFTQSVIFNVFISLSIEDKTLSMLNVMGGCNDRQIDAVVNHYNLLEKILG